MMHYTSKGSKLNLKHEKLDYLERKSGFKI